MQSSESISAFSINRIKLLSSRFYLLNQKNWLVGLLGIAALLFTMWLIPVVITAGDSIPSFSALLQGPAMFAYIIGGLAITSRIFHEVHSPTTCYQFLTLPATTFEKFGAAWLVTTIGYTVAAMLAIVLLSFSVETLSALIKGSWSQFALFNPFKTEIFGLISRYLFYQSIFMLGAIYFVKNNFLKTVLAYILIVISLLISIGLIVMIFGLTYQGEVSINMQIEGISWLIPESLQAFARIVFSLFLLLLTYLQLRRTQVA